MGISSFRYRHVFEKGKRKDGDGKVRQWKDGEPRPVVEIYNPIYTKLETICASAVAAQIQDFRKNSGIRPLETPDLILRRASESRPPALGPED